MTTGTGTTLDERAPARAKTGRAERGPLGHPLAFVVTALVLLAVFGGTFVANPDRVAPTKDPAYYTWRTEALLSEDPVRLLEITGPFDMFAGGYRVAAPVIGGFLRRIPAISSLHTTAFLMAVVPVLTALLLAGFAYRCRRDPLLWHAVAYGSASLYFTPPFVGYLDNILCLMMLAAALWFLSPARSSWPARAGLFVFLLMAGFTHPTTLALFCMVLGAIAAIRLVARRFDLRAVARDDGPVLLTAGAAVVATYLVWAVGPWGESASLGEAALPPPYGSSFFLDRMVDWIAVMRPALNGPLLAAGVVGLLAAGRRWVDDELALVSIVWLAPLAGLFGFLAGIAYPYYRFFNSTLAWVLLVGIGAFFLIRMFLGLARRGGIARLALVGVAAVVAVVVTNFTSGLEQAGWNDPDKGWISAAARTDLDALRAALEGSDRPVVFVIDDDASGFQIWGYTKLAGNTSRYGLPPGRIDEGYLYLGSLGNYLRGRPTSTGETTYDRLSPALLEDARAGVRRAGEEPIVVVAAAFNPRGSNAGIATGEEAPPPGAVGADVWVVRDGVVEGLSSEAPEVGSTPREEPDPGLGHIALALLGLAVLLVPGLLALRWFVPGAGWAEAVGMVPALSIALLTLAGFAVLAVARAPFGTALAWVSLGIAAAAALLLARAGARGRRNLHRGAPAPA
ncbi:MAG TPA: hypothetical protein VHK89_03670 [Actinomycetota bacterium]|nr:hypothetical protein [Actinomycetota bacterium]